MRVECLLLFLTCSSLAYSGGRVPREAVAEPLGAGASGADLDDELVAGVLERDQWVGAVQVERMRVAWTPLPHSVVFSVEAETRGYVGLGFSLDGKMASADLVVAWVDDITGKPYLIDCHGGGGHAAPMRDQEQNYQLLSGHQNITHTVVRFSRAWDTCDTQDDLVLTNDTVRLLWALYDEDPMDEDRGALLWHGRGSRGVQSVHLITPPLPPPQDDTMKAWEIRQEKVEIPENTDTLYWCKIFKAPSINRKHQIVGFEPIVDTNKSGAVHHMVLYECITEPSLMERFAKQPGQVCYSSKIPPEWDLCVTPVLSWAIGSAGEFLPSQVGLPLQSNKATFMMLEVHYDNPTLRRAVHTAGLKIHYTSQLRPHDGGVFITGVAVSPLQIIPPRQVGYRTAGYCDNECTNSVLPSTGIQVTSVVLHSHLAGRKIKLRHIRHGHELTPIAQDEQYDFNYQQARRLPKEVTIYPGDQLITECSYQTLNRPQPTMGGYSTKQEMCLSFITYYPKVQLAGCYSMPTIPHFFHTFGVKQFYHYDMETVEKMFLKLSDNKIRKSNRTDTHWSNVASDDEAAILTIKKMADYTVDETHETNLFQDLMIQEPSEFQDKTFLDHLIDVPWDEPLLTQRVEETLYKGKHINFCRLSNDTLAMPLVVSTFPNITELSPARPSNNTKCALALKRKLQVSLNRGSSNLSPLGLLTATLIFLRILQL